ncbi:MAG: sterol desaturase family protein [Arenicella sp.]|nr:sterol desaturase family protein [Arenicella sp.]
MPSPISILLGPTSLGCIGIYIAIIVLQAIIPGRDLPKVKGWYTRAVLSFVVYFFLSTYLPMYWDKYLAQYQLVDLGSMNPFLSAGIAVLVFELLIYIWHRAMHQSDFLWRTFHQMHHSAERVDAVGAFYFSPLDMIGFTMVGSLSLALIVGISPQATTYFLFASFFLGMIQHTNISTPQWLGYLIQRPESHTIHHGKSIHGYNYSDLPLFDILFGTFRNPKGFEVETGFYLGASAQIGDMLLCKEISNPKPIDHSL